MTRINTIISLLILLAFFGLSLSAFNDRVGDQNILENNTTVQNLVDSINNLLDSLGIGSGIHVKGGSYYFEPSMITVEQGETVEFVFENIGGTHDFVIPELGVGTDVIQGGQSESFTHTFKETGEFEFECSVGNHAAQGMVGTIIVE